MPSQVLRVRRDRSQLPVLIAAVGLGFFGLAQVLMVSWAWRHKPRELDSPVQKAPSIPANTSFLIRPTPSPFKPILPDSTSIDSSDPAKQFPTDPPPEVVEHQIESIDQDVTLPATDDLGHQTTVPSPLQSRQAAKHLALAAVFEKDQDMLNALQNLQQAERLESGHPEVLYRLGTIYQRIGNQAQANTYFSRVASMGHSIAGQFATLSNAYLRGKDPESRQGGPLERSMSIQKITQQFHGPTENPDSLSLLIPIKYNSEEPIDPSQCLTLVYFYDIIDGIKIEQNLVTDIDFRWRTEPVDWASHPEELLEIIYHLPLYDQPEEETPPSRQYFGYVLKLFYRDEIQDVIIEPRMLVEKLSPEAEDFSTTSDNPLFPN